MNYQQIIEYLYNSMPMFQREGKSAYKIGLGNILALCEALGNPHLKFKSVHVAGTNGKGSSSHYLAAILQSAGYKVGLFTSPHLKSFTERVKMNGTEVSQQYVIDFVKDYKSVFEEIKPSFFELTTALSFKYFADNEVDVAIIEVGMGGRLDSTNIIQPEVCLITNIGLDHIEYLGTTIQEIAAEKAGIIKQNTPVVISEFQHETVSVFEAFAKEKQTKLVKAYENYKVLNSTLAAGILTVSLLNVFENKEFVVKSELIGKYQLNNIIGVLAVIDLLQSQGNFKIENATITKGFEQVVKLTGLKGRWQQLGEKPFVFCDTGHNESGIKLVLEQLNSYQFTDLFIVLGMVNDKSHEKILSLLPQSAHYIFCQATIPRALDAYQLQIMASEFGLSGEVVVDVNEAIIKAKSLANQDDFILVGGSTFVVAEINEI